MEDEAATATAAAAAAAAPAPPLDDHLDGVSFASVALDLLVASGSLDDSADLISVDPHFDADASGCCPLDLAGIFAAPQKLNASAAPPDVGDKMSSTSSAVRSSSAASSSSSSPVVLDLTALPSFLSLSLDMDDEDDLDFFFRPSSAASASASSRARSASSSASWRTRSSSARFSASAVRLSNCACSFLVSFRPRSSLDCSVASLLSSSAILAASASRGARSKETEAPPTAKG